MVTLELEMFPDPLVTEQVWPEGCEETVTWYADPVVNLVVKAKDPF